MKTATLTAILLLLTACAQKPTVMEIEEIRQYTDRLAWVDWEVKNDL